MTIKTNEECRGAALRCSIRHREITLVQFSFIALQSKHPFGHFPDTVEEISLNLKTRQSHGLCNFLVMIGGTDVYLVGV